MMGPLVFSIVSALTFVCVNASVDAPVSDEDAVSDELQWETDYYTGHTRAGREQKMLLVYFFDPSNPVRQFEEETLQDAEIRKLCQKYVLVKVPTDTVINGDGGPSRLLNHAAFKHMYGRQGLTVIDLKNDGQSYYGRAVSCLPFESPVYYAPNYWSKKSLRILLQLPAGTLTQRTMVYAVRCHPENPASSQGTPDPTLLEATASHSAYQARIRLQGHHHWDRRFPRLWRLLGGKTPTEVCAESWPGERLVPGCFSCVHAWRQSSGHWGAVRSWQPAFGFDVRRGSNSIWYATGIFGGLRR